MEGKTMLKLVASIILVNVAFFGPIFLFMWLCPNYIGAIAGTCLGIALSVEIVRECYPVWFKDYIEDFWRREEEKHAKKEE